MSVFEIIIDIAALIISLVFVFGFGYMAGWNKREKDTNGTLRLVYDPDDPDHPAMGLMIESMVSLENSSHIVLNIEKKNYPIRVNVVDGPREKHPL